MPFTEAELFAVFSAWNNAVWPLQVVAYLLGLIVVSRLIVPSPNSTRSILMILALMWLVNGMGFHWLFYTKVTGAAWVFGAAFVLEGGILLAALFVAQRERFSPRRDLPTLFGVTLIAYSMVIYPALGYALGQRFPATPTFGIIPCPTTIFTIGVLLLGSWRWARWLLIILCLWGAIGGSAAILFGVPQDYGLILSMLIVLGIAIGQAFRIGLVEHEL